MLMFQSRSVSYGIPEAVLGFRLFMIIRKSTNLDDWIKFSIIKSYHSLCLRKIETNIKLHQLFLQKTD